MTYTFKGVGLEQLNCSFKGGAVKKSSKTKWPSTADSMELYSLACEITSKLKNPEDKEVFRELLTRFMDYIQINGSGIPAANVEDAPPYKAHILELRYAIDFFRSISKPLSDHDMIDWNQPIEKAGPRLREQIRGLKANPIHLTALICEIYARSGVKYNHLALPDEIRQPVELILKKTGQIS